MLDFYGILAKHWLKQTVVERIQPEFSIPNKINSTQLFDTVDKQKQTGIKNWTTTEKTNHSEENG